MPKNPPLSYSLPGFSPGGYQHHRRWLANLQELGFRWVTFTPTYLVYDEAPPRIDAGRGPSLRELRDAVAHAVGLGFNVKLEPHVDWETTLTGGPYEWRRKMYLRPFPEYTQQILAPLLALLSNVAFKKVDTRLTLGSELDVASLEFANEWQLLLETLREQESGVKIGHKINHDSLLPSKAVRDVLNEQRGRNGLVPAGRAGYAQRMTEMNAYLSRLDYVSFSFYPDVRMGRSDEWWREPAQGGQIGDVAECFRAKTQELYQQLRNAAGASPAYSIGEFGIGCTDPARPYHFDAKTFLEPDGSMSAGARELRRKYYLGFLDFLKRSANLIGEEPSTFWTVTHYDFLGALEQCNMEPFRDDTLRQAIKLYNEEQ